MPPRIARFAGLGAFGAAAGLLALLALLLYGTRPGATAGMDGTLRALTWMAFTGIILALVLVHWIFGRQLLMIARNESSTIY